MNCVINAMNVTELCIKGIADYHFLLVVMKNMDEYRNRRIRIVLFRSVPFCYILFNNEQINRNIPGNTFDDDLWQICVAQVSLKCI